MCITEVRIKLTNNNQERLHGFCSVTFDGNFVLHDVKIIQKENGEFFIAMPSRKLMDHCPKCNTKNHLRARYCNNCGEPLNEMRAPREGYGNVYADIAHPINPEFREILEEAVLKVFFQEKERLQTQGYTCRYDAPHQETRVQ